MLQIKNLNSYRKKTHALQGTSKNCFKWGDQKNKYE